MLGQRAGGASTPLEGYRAYLITLFDPKEPRDNGHACLLSRGSCLAGDESRRNDLPRGYKLGVFGSQACGPHPCAQCRLFCEAFQPHARSPVATGLRPALSIPPVWANPRGSRSWDESSCSGSGLPCIRCRSARRRTPPQVSSERCRSHGRTSSRAPAAS